jgi:hypothetical protein
MSVADDEEFATRLFEDRDATVAEVHTFVSAEDARRRGADDAGWAVPGLERHVYGSSVVVWWPLADAFARVRIAGCLDR